MLRLTTWIAALLAVGFMTIGMVSGAAAQSGPYKLRSGDVIEISVLEDPSLNRRVLVRPDGLISMPLAGTVAAAGRSLEAVQADVQSRLLGSFVNAPSVTASLVSIAPPPIPAPPPPPEPEEPPVIFSVYVLGEVQRPGKFDYDSEKPITVLQALTLAGGPATFAARDRIQIRRTDEAGETITLFNYDALESDGVAAPLFALTDGDVIVVPERTLFD